MTGESKADWRKENLMVKREVVAVCMESPLYFTMPLRKRLQLVKQHEQEDSADNLRKVLLIWVKNGVISDKTLIDLNQT